VPVTHYPRTLATLAYATLAYATLTLACSHRPTEPDSNVPAFDHFSLVSGASAQGVVGSELDQPLIVRAYSATGIGAPGVAIKWSLDGGMETIQADTLTDANGMARARLKVGPTAGYYMIGVFANGDNHSSSIFFPVRAVSATN
jgi:hypothetical protein